MRTTATSTLELHLNSTILLLDMIINLIFELLALKLLLTEYLLVSLHQILKFFLILGLVTYVSELLLKLRIHQSLDSSR